MIELCRSTENGIPGRKTVSHCSFFFCVLKSWFHFLYRQLAYISTGIPFYGFFRGVSRTRLDFSRPKTTVNCGLYPSKTFRSLESFWQTTVYRDMKTMYPFFCLLGLEPIFYRKKKHRYTVLLCGDFVWSRTRLDFCSPITPVNREITGRQQYSFMVDFASISCLRCQYRRFGAFWVQTDTHKHFSNILWESL